MDIPFELIVFCASFGLLFAGVFAAALFSKWIQVSRAAHWPVASGVVLRARVRGRRRYSIGGRSRFDNEPLVTYEYQVGETTYRASRLSFAEHISGPAMAAALQRFPAGRRVQVYYNPRNPREAVLERDLPRGGVLWIGLLAAGMVGAALFIPLAVGSGAGWLATWIPAPEKALFVALAAGIGIFTLVMAYALHHQVQASTYWSTAEGRVLNARDEAYLDWVSHGSTGRLKTFYRPGIVYAYSVDGHQYLSDRIDFDLSFGWGNRGSVRSVLEKYPEDSAVTVYYDPGSPGEAVLERRSRGVWIFAAAAAGLFLLAAWAGGWI